MPALREREIVTVFRYERLFDEYLRASVPGLDPLDAVGFAALVTAVHNHVLRQLLRGRSGCAVSVLRTAFDDVLRRFGVHPDGDGAAPTTTSSWRSSRDGCRRPRSRGGCASASTERRRSPTRAGSHRPDRVARAVWSKP